MGLGLGLGLGLGDRHACNANIVLIWDYYLIVHSL